jgi:hypothetical protein
LGPSTTFQTINVSRETGVYANGNAYLNSTSENGLGSADTISYDATSGAYVVSSVENPQRSATFGAADLISNDGYARSYLVRVGSTSDELTLYGNVGEGTGNRQGALRLTYLSYGKWSHVNDSADLTKVTYLLFGFPTTSAKMPRSGTASYRTMVTGSSYSADSGGILGELGGSATLSADFGTSTVATSLTLKYVGSASAIGTFDGVAAISGDQYAGSFTSSVDHFSSGSFTGGFFGPAAQETGYNYLIRIHPSDPYAGASLRPYDFWFIGSVLGKKQ